MVTYTLTDDDPCNTSLVPSSSVSSPELVYAVQTEVTRAKQTSLTPAGGGTVASLTRVTNKVGEIIATLQWRDTLPDKVTLRDARPIAMTSWMSGTNGLGGLRHPR